MKIQSLHFLRGIACFLVVICHANFFGISQYLIANYKIYFGMVGVDIFFLISGFVIPLSVEKITITEFAKRRFFRIYPVFMVGILFFCIIHNLNIIQHFKQDWFGYFFLTDFVTDPRNASEAFMPVSWTLTIEAEFYVMIGFLLAFRKKLEVKSILMIQIVLIILRVITDNRFLFLTWGSLHTMLLATSIYFLLKKEKLAHLSIALSLFGVFLAYKTNVDIQGLDSFIPLNFPLAIVIAMIFIFMRFSSKLLNFFGNISYALYLLHVPTYQLIQKLELNQFFYALLSLALMLSLSWMLHVFVEKPFIQLSKRKFIGASVFN
jgi:peptidoglycan/LPS O-acetylase OafA/YrhL